VRRDPALRARATTAPAEDRGPSAEYAATREQWAPIRSTPLANTARAVSASATSAAFGWNVVVIVVGSVIAVIGLLVWAAADPTNSALRQTMAALWLIAALLGLLIAAAGVLGTTIVHTPERGEGGPMTATSRKLVLGGGTGVGLLCAAAIGIAITLSASAPVCPVVFEQLYQHNVELLRRGGADEARAERLASVVTSGAINIAIMINKEEGPLGEFISTASSAARLATRCLP
jgi:hypothetical protein